MAAIILAGCGAEREKPAPPSLPVSVGALDAGLRGNATWGNSGLTYLRHRGAGAQALRVQTVNSGTDAVSCGGLNYEHVISGIASPNNFLSPRGGDFPLTSIPDGARLDRRAQDDPWRLDATLTYRLVAPHYVDFEFQATFTDASPFGAPGFAAFLFATYIEGAEDPEINFRGLESAGAPEGWVRSRAAPPKPGEHYAVLNAAPVAADPSDSLAALNIGQQDWPRMTQPYFFGRCVPGMVYAVMLDKLLTPTEEIRFTVMRWKAPQSPAWDFSYVVRNIQSGQRVRLRGRAVWKPFVSADDISNEYAAWKATLPP